jgi:hypothetical protein
MLFYLTSFLALAATLALGGYGGHLAAEVINDPKHRRNAMFIVWGLVIFSVFLSGAQQVLTYRADEQRAKDMRDLPRSIAEYIRNTSPPLTLATTTVAGSVPAPPTGVVAVVDGHTGAAGMDIATAISNFLAAQGDPPRKGPGESEVDFLIRSNAWYKKVMSAYKENLQAQAETMSRVMVEAHILPDSVLALALDPVNIIGIRAVANQLRTAGEAYEKSVAH